MTTNKFNPQKYIITENIPQFQKFMQSDNVTALSLYSHLTYNDLMVLKSGRRRDIIRVPSNKFDIENGLVSMVQYLAPAQHVSGLNVCRFASEGCKKSCLGYTGRMALNVERTYVQKTIALYLHTEKYLTDLLNDLDTECYAYAKEDKFVYLRLNGLSDLPFDLVIDFDLLFEDIPNFLGGYDYTKKPVNDQTINHHYTYSWNERSTLQIANRFDRVAYVVLKKDKVRLMSEYPDIFTDGNISDIRPKDITRHVLLPFKGKVTDNDFVMSYDAMVGLLGLDNKECVK